MRPFLIAALLLASSASAQEILTGSEIREAVAGNTIAGGMLATGPYTEFYGADGEIRGDGYTGVWTVDADRMCFDYGDGPDCWSVGANGDEIVWIKDGEVLGAGRATAGNVNDF